MYYIKNASGLILKDGKKKSEKRLWNFWQVMME